ncbi:hypothetical protein BWI17_07040 [Betaproteobacteria bacterium GR16-43]|nr:hypothetical protein BWI17_07040 [Betaproteobacteria bacterium GR16-43]
MNPLRIPACILLAAALFSGAAIAQPPLSRTQALQRLTDADAAKRREAAARLGEVGVMADVTALVKELRDDDEEARAYAEQSLWKIWERSGDKNVDALYRKGMQQMAAGLGDEAVETFTRIIQMKPAFAEAWNKRATVHFMMGEYEKSLADCDEVMKRNPYHFGALAGYFQIYMELEDYERALRYGRRALAVNPNMDGVKNGVETLERRLGRSSQSI